MRKKNWFVALKYFTFFMVFVFLFHTTINQNTTYFAIAFLLCAVWCNQKIYSLLPIMLIAAFVSGVPLFTIFVYAGAGLVLCFAYFIHFKAKKPLNIFTLNLYLFLSQLLFFILSAGNFALILKTGINIFLCMIFFNAIINFLQPLLLRRRKPKFNFDEVISGGVFLIMLSSGASNLNFAGIAIGEFFVFLLIFVMVYTLAAGACISLSVTLAFGYLVSNIDVASFTVFVCVALTMLAFKKAGKIYGLLASLLIFSVLIYYFEIYSFKQFTHLVNFVFAGVCFLFISNNFLLAAERFFESKSVSASMQISGFSKKAASRKLIETAGVFAAIEDIFKKNIKSTLTPEVAKDVLCGELVGSVCKKCPNFTSCHTLSTDVKPVLTKLVSNGLTRGKVTILDIPPFLAAKCSKIPQLITQSGELSTKYLKFNNIQKNSNAGIEIVVDQMAALSSSVLLLAKSIDEKTVFNVSLIAKIEEALTYKNIYFEEVLVIEKQQKIEVIISFKKTDEINEDEIENIVFYATKIKMEIVNRVENGQNLVMTFFESPKLDVVFGVAANPKTGNEESGDSHSFVKIDSGKFLMALCDGMGSGEDATRISAEAISLIENFYKAGFDNSLILSNVNKLLALSGNEEFSALDICVLDLFKKEAAFFKLGAPEGFVKNKAEVQIIDGGALPIGLLSEMEPKITVLEISEKDVIVLMTDGVFDAFKDKEEIKEMIASIEGNNPQTIANILLAAAKEKNGGTFKDDATVIASRVFIKI